MKKAIITLTTGGLELAKKIKSLDVLFEIHTSSRRADVECHRIEGSFGDYIGELFETCDLLIFIMASGIVVRTLAPYLRHKSTDPAVLVLDEKGRFVISLLSGHLGKANVWSQTVADHIGGTAVITTASDVNGIVAVDTLAELLNCAIVDYNDAKLITAQLIEKKKIAVCCPYELPESVDLPRTVVDQVVSQQSSFDGIIYISDTPPDRLSCPYVWLVPRTVTVGIGCKRGKTEEELSAFLSEQCSGIKLPIQSISTIATISIKHDEKGLLSLAKRLRVPLQCIEIEEVKKVEERFEGSTFVEKTLGVKAVSEPCGYIASGFGDCLLSVQKHDGMTLSIWKNKVVEP